MAYPRFARISPSSSAWAHIGCCFRALTSMILAATRERCGAAVTRPTSKPYERSIRMGTVSCFAPTHAPYTCRLACNFACARVCCCASWHRHASARSQSPSHRACRRGAESRPGTGPRDKNNGGGVVAGRPGCRCKRRQQDSVHRWRKRGSDVQIAGMLATEPSAIFSKRVRHSDGLTSSSKLSRRADGGAR